MDFMVNIDLKKPSKQINYKDKILLIRFMLYRTYR